MGNKFNLEGMSVDDSNNIDTTGSVTATGGFVGDLDGDATGLEMSGPTDIVSIVSSGVNGGISINANDTTTIDGGKLDIRTDTIEIRNLPTSDPTNANQLWSNSGVLTVSAG